MKNEKKKLIVLIVLGTALVAVGAFQFIPKDNPTPVASKPKPQVKPAAEGTANAPASGTGMVAHGEVDPQKAMLQQLVKDPLPKRDPFSPQGGPNLEKEQAAPQPLTTAQPVVTKRPGRSAWSEGYTGPAIGGSLEPLDPGLPSGSVPGGPTTMTQAPPLRKPGEMQFQVKGILVGKKPMAVIEDDNGSQRLVPLGGSVDGDSKIVGIEKGKVRIRHRGKNKTLTLPEGP